MLAQGILGFQYEYESDKTESNLTAFAGLPLYLEMARASGLCAGIASQLKSKTRGWTDLESIL